MYFVDDVLEAGWKVVRHKEPRSKRVISDSDTETLSAAGHIDATTFLPDRIARHAGDRVEVDAEPILAADVEQVSAHREEEYHENADADMEEVDEVGSDNDFDDIMDGNTEAVAADPTVGMDF